MKAVIIVVVALAAAMVSAAPASADDDPAVGTGCQAGQLDNMATASDGMVVRCVANEQSGFSWMADTGAVGTIAQLENEGYTVNITRLGPAPLDRCMVTDVRNPRTFTRTDRSGTSGSGLRTIVISKTIDVTLDCRG